ncbi:truncated hemoglobin YjbI [Pseudomonas sp. 2835]
MGLRAYPAGGIDGLRRLVDDFYRLMDENHEAHTVRQMHPYSLDASRDKLACFLQASRDRHPQA